MLYQTINPLTEEVIKVFPEHADAELEEIIAKAESVYESDWRPSTLPKRKAVLKKAAAILREKRDEFAKLVTLEMGKLFREAQAEVDLSADILDYYADNASNFLATHKLQVADGEALVDSEPLGVLFCAEPWNFLPREERQTSDRPRERLAVWVRWIGDYAGHRSGKASRPADRDRNGLHQSSDLDRTRTHVRRREKFWLGTRTIRVGHKRVCEHETDPRSLIPLVHVVLLGLVGETAVTITPVT